MEPTSLSLWTMEGSPSGKPLLFVKNLDLEMVCSNLCIVDTECTADDITSCFRDFLSQHLGCTVSCKIGFYLYTLMIPAETNMFYEVMHIILETIHCSLYMLLG